jgi:hypothetical protein
MPNMMGSAYFAVIDVQVFGLDALLLHKLPDMFISGSLSRVAFLCTGSGRAFSVPPSLPHPCEHFSTILHAVAPKVMGHPWPW